MKKTGPVLAVWIAVVGFFVDPTPHTTVSPEKPAFKITIIGNAPDCTSAEHTPKLDVECAVFRGADAASKSELFQHSISAAKISVKIDYKNDKGDPEEASRLARSLVADEETLAVIGHSRSQTTRAAVRIYAEANMAIMLANSSSVLATVPAPVPMLTALGWFDSHFRGRRSENAFRIIPNDSDGQAPAIVNLVRALLQKDPSEVLLIADTAGNNANYAVPLTAAIASRMMPTQSPMSSAWGYARVGLSVDGKRDLTSDSELKQALSGRSTVVYVGEADGADRFLPAALEVFNDAKPHYIILSDSNKGLSLNKLRVPPNIHLLLTFPAPYFSASHTPKSRLEALFMASVLETATQSYEIYGYDSMLMLAKAIERMQGKIGRRELVAVVRDMPGFHGVQGIYLMHDGENVLREYSIYSSDLPVAKGINTCVPFGDGDRPGALPDGFSYACTIKGEAMIESSL